MYETYLRPNNIQEKAPSHIKSNHIGLSSNRLVDIIDQVSKKKGEVYYMTSSKLNHINAGKENLHMRRKGHLKMLSSSDNITYCRFCQNIYSLSHASITPENSWDPSLFGNNG